jgi:GntR family transcriptional regulator
MDISLNAKIYMDLKSKIETGIYKADELLPTELMFQKHYNVSRAPVRQALGRLENDGLIFRVAGKGTFVANQDSWKLAELGGFRMEFLKKSDKVKCNTLKVKHIKPSKKLSELFETSNDEELIYVERIRYINNIPYQFLQHYLHGIGYENVASAGDIEDMPLFLSQNGLFLNSVTEEIEAIPASYTIAKKLEQATGAPILKIKRSAYDAENKLYEYMEYYTVSKHWKYRVKYLNYKQ